LLLLALAGCPEPEPVLPTVAIVAPADGSTTSSGDVAVEVEVTDFDLVAPEETARFVPLPLWWAPSMAFAHEPGEEPEGYLHVTVDDEELLDTIELEFTLEALASGSHTIEVELLYPDGDAFYPAVRDSIDITVP
jgi:hypothetical protein